MIREMEGQNYTYHVFLGHNGSQKDWARQLADRLKKEGLYVCFDEDSIRIGEDISRAIEETLRSSRHLIPVMSKEAFDSPWIALELSMALFQDPGAVKRVILPNLRTDCDIPLRLARLKYLDAREATPAHYRPV